MQLFLLEWYFWLVIEKLKIGRGEPDCKVISFCIKDSSKILKYFDVYILTKGKIGYIIRVE